MASHLHLPLQEVKAKTTSSEFTKWTYYLQNLVVQMEMNVHDKQDYYLAQIAAEIRRGLVKKPESVRVKNFLLKFKFDKDKKKGTDAKTRMLWSKSFWLGGLGLTRKKKK